jgi:hypothetical protein
MTVNRGSGKAFKLIADRTDSFDGEIQLDIANLPPGFFVTSPLSIQAGQWSVEGALYAFADAPEPPCDAWNNVKITSKSMINKQEVVKEVGNLGAVKLAAAPKILVSLSPPDKEPAPPGEIPELVVRPGQTITATLRVKRQGYDDVLSFGGDDSGRGLAHGVYVDNIGLNGVLLLAGQSERTVFIYADTWVPASSRLLFLKSAQEDGQCSWPVRVTVQP